MVKDLGMHPAEVPPSSSKHLVGFSSKWIAMNRKEFLMVSSPFMVTDKCRIKVF